MAQRRAAPLLLSAAAHRAATSTVLLSAPAATTSTQLLSTPLVRHAGLVGRRAVSCPASFPNVATRTCGFSSGVLGNRATAPTHLASTGTLLATRGMASQPPFFPPEFNRNVFSPELQKELHRLEEASAARQQEAAKLLKDLQSNMKKDYALHKVNKANSVVKDARIGWRIVYGSLAAGAVAILCVVYSYTLWLKDFKATALFYLYQLVAKLKLELEEELKKVVREEVEKSKK